MAANQQVRLTSQRLEKLTCPAGLDRVYVYDADVRGLCISILASGAKAWYLYRRVGGRPVRTRLGEWPAVSVDDARKLANRTLGEIAKGHNPHAERLKARAETTLREVWDRHIEHARQHNRPASCKEDERLWTRYLERWANRRLSELDRNEVEKWHRSVGEKHGKYAANRMLALLKHMIRTTAARMGYAGTNPTAGIERYKERSRDRYLTADELPRFFAAVEEEPELFRDYFTLAILTGARRSNLSAMAWADVNLDTGVWKIPADKAKAGEAIAVPLVPEAVDILKRRREANENTEYVFPGRSKGHLQEPKKAWDRIRQRAGLADLRLHDLRRTFGSWQAAAGVSLHAIGKSMGHRNQSTTAIYARLALDPIREGVLAGTSAMLAAARAKPKTDDTTEGGSNG